MVLSIASNPTERRLIRHFLVFTEEQKRLGKKRKGRKPFGT